MATQELITTNDKELVPRKSEELDRFMPVMSLDQALERREIIVQAVGKLLKEGTKGEKDYGILPGTNRKCLYQAGADKLNNLFGLVPTFQTLKEEYDWTGEHHGGEPFFYIKVKCQLYRGTHIMGEAIGSCNSWEEKYRYRKEERVCPHCGVAAIIKGQEKYGGGWLCWKKKEGCGAKFKDGDKSIEGQQTGNILNPNVHELVNTIEKMATKRAKVSACINATSAHEFFTPDLDDVTPPAPAPSATDPQPPWEVEDPAARARAYSEAALRAQAEVKDRKIAELKQQVEEPAPAKFQYVDPQPVSPSNIQTTLAALDRFKARWNAARGSGTYVPLKTKTGTGVLNKAHLDIYKDLRLSLENEYGKTEGYLIYVDHLMRYMPEEKDPHSDRFKDTGSAARCGLEIVEHLAKRYATKLDGTRNPEEEERQRMEEVGQDA